MIRKGGEEIVSNSSREETEKRQHQKSQRSQTSRERVQTTAAGLEQRERELCQNAQTTQPRDPSVERRLGQERARLVQVPLAHQQLCSFGLEHTERHLVQSEPQLVQFTSSSTRTSWDQFKPSASSLVRISAQ